MTISNTLRSGLTGLVLVLFGLLAPVEADAQAINSSDPTIRSVVQPCINRGHAELFPPSSSLNDRLDAWTANIDSGKEYRLRVRSDDRSAKIGTFAIYLTSNNILSTQQMTGTYVYDGDISLGYEPRPGSRRMIIVLHSPQSVNYEVTLEEESTGRSTATHSGLGDLRRWVVDMCGSGGSTPSYSPRVGSGSGYGYGPRKMSSGMTWDYWGDFGSSDYAGTSESSQLVQITGAGTYQKGLSENFALVAGAEGAFHLPGGPVGAEDGELSEVSSSALRGFAGLNMGGYLEVGYGLMGRTATGSDGSGNVRWGDAGLITNEAVKGTAILPLGDFRIRGDAWSTMNLLSSAAEDGSPSLSESVYRFELGMDFGGLGMSLQDYSYDPGSEGGRTLSSYATTFFVAFHF